MKEINTAVPLVPIAERSFVARQLALRERLREQRQNDGLPSFDADTAPFVSIIVLNCNGKEILPRCIEFLITQSYPRFEILVVDNGSSDGSVDVVRGYSNQNVRLVRSDTNLGVAGGRNLGMRSANGEIFAFIDNDGYAAVDWLEHAVAKLLSAPEIGAVGSLVFFDRNKLVINGACATQNLQWYAGDLCFNQPYEFARLPAEAMYPMGCGMLICKSLAVEIGELDETTPKWFDDTELGIRVRLRGKKVALAQEAIIDHGFHGSHSANPVPGWKQAFMFERARVRTGLKYQAASGLPLWLLAELKLFFEKLLSPAFKHAPILLLAWCWNIINLNSVFSIRRKFLARGGLATELIVPGWGEYPPPTPASHMLEIREPEAGAVLSAANAEMKFQLHYGFYNCEKFEGTPVLWSDGVSAALINPVAPAKELSCFIFPASAPFTVKLSLREFGELAPVGEFEISQSEEGWREYRFALSIEPGCYELLFHSDTLAERSKKLVSFGLGEIVLR